MTLIPGHTYEFSYYYENGSVAGNLDPFMFAYENTSMSSYAGGIKSWNLGVAANESGRHTVTWTIPAGRPYVTMRLGMTTVGMVTKFSDIYIRDISNPAGAQDNVSEPNVGGTAVHGVSVKYGYTIGSADTLDGNMPTISRTGYTFEGWYDSQDYSGKKYEKTDYDAFNNGITLYAKWSD